MKNINRYQKQLNKNILVYRVFTTLIYPLLLVYILIRKLKKEDRDRYKEKIFTSYFNIKRKKFKIDLVSYSVLVNSKA